MEILNYSIQMRFYLFEILNFDKHNQKIVYKPENNFVCQNPWFQTNKIKFKLNDSRFQCYKNVKSPNNKTHNTYQYPLNTHLGKGSILKTMMVRFGPRFSKFCWPVRDFKCGGPGPVQSEIKNSTLVLIRSDFLFIRSWSDFPALVRSKDQHRTGGSGLTGFGPLIPGMDQAI